LQIAFTMTVVVNAWVMIAERIEKAQRPSGVVEDELFHIATQGFTRSFNAKVSLEDDLALLRQTPGIVDAVPVNAVPLSTSGWSMGLQLESGDDQQAESAAVYMVDDHGINTLGVDLLAGRNFTPNEIRERDRSASGWPDKTILTEAMAKRLWPDDNPLEVVGRTIYINNHDPLTIIGVIDRLQAPWSGSDTVEQSILVPDKTLWESVRYMIRTEPGRRDEMMPIIEETLARSNSERIVRAPESMAETRKDSYALDSGLAKMLGAIMAMLIGITTLGIVGLVSFSVRRRTKQIGTRRALGATRGNILRYFLLESLLITTIGLLLGATMTIGFNMLLVAFLNFPKIVWFHVPVGMLVLLGLGLIAVLGPAQRATSVPPAVATRTV